MGGWEEAVGHIGPFKWFQPSEALSSVLQSSALQNMKARQRAQHRNQCRWTGEEKIETNMVHWEVRPLMRLKIAFRCERQLNHMCMNTKGLSLTFLISFSLPTVGQKVFPHWYERRTVHAFPWKRNTFAVKRLSKSWSTVTAAKAGSDFLSQSCYFHHSSLNRICCQALYKLLFYRCREAVNTPIVCRSCMLENLSSSTLVLNGQRSPAAHEWVRYVLLYCIGHLYIFWWQETARQLQYL